MADPASDSNIPIGRDGVQAPYKPVGGLPGSPVNVKAPGFVQLDSHGQIVGPNPPSLVQLLSEINDNLRAIRLGMAQLIDEEL